MVKDVWEEEEEGGGGVCTQHAPGALEVTGSQVWCTAWKNISPVLFPGALPNGAG